MAELKFTILGCGSSGGVPRLGGLWGACDPQNPRNQRTRCSLLVERATDEGCTRVLIDTSPDMRAQLLAADVGTLDAVVFTHEHADHTHGLDDLRMIVFNMRKRLDVWANSATQTSLMARFGYAFVQPSGSPYPPILDMHTIDGTIEIDGPGGAIHLHPFEVAHGAIDSLGFRIGDVAYLPDVSELTEEARAALENLGVWIVDALRRDPHPTHSHLAQTLNWIEDIAPSEAVLTNMHNDLDYATVEAETPANVTPAYDGMVIRRPIP
ncbi:MAG: MBL fold metallo-hydrolase [Dinoroseobacter sp.]|nr:MBL fold metallo-hydrolase [Dinoroseobacter sp.]